MTNIYKKYPIFPKQEALTKINNKKKCKQYEKSIDLLDFGK